MIRERRPSGMGLNLTSTSCRAAGCLLMLGLLLAVGAVSCSSDSAPIQESQYAQAIVGNWQGTVGDMKETITFTADGKFVSQVRPRGFISNTLGQGTTGTIQGTWTLKDKAMTLNISSSENEQLLNKATSSTIVSFTQNQLVVKSASGETSTFLRAVKL
jgi:hypothetical protein